MILRSTLGVTNKDRVDRPQWPHVSPVWIPPLLQTMLAWEGHWGTQGRSDKLVWPGRYDDAHLVLLSLWSDKGCDVSPTAKVGPCPPVPIATNPLPWTAFWTWDHWKALQLVHILSLSTLCGWKIMFYNISTSESYLNVHGYVYIYIDVDQYNHRATAET